MGKARIEDRTSDWKEAGAAARVAASQTQEGYWYSFIWPHSKQVGNANGYSYWVDKSHLADIKVLANTRCVYDRSAGEDYESAKHERANELMKMTREKFSSPLSPAMRSF